MQKAAPFRSGILLLTHSPITTDGNGVRAGHSLEAAQAFDLSQHAGSALHFELNRALPLTGMSLNRAGSSFAGRAQATPCEAPDPYKQFPPELFELRRRSAVAAGCEARFDFEKPRPDGRYSIQKSAWESLPMPPPLRRVVFPVSVSSTARTDWSALRSV